MLNSRWRKAFRDLWVNKTRTVLVILAIGIGIVGASWNKTTKAEFAARRFDADVQLKRPYPSPELQLLIAGLPDVVVVETWADVKTSLIYADGS